MRTISVLAGIALVTVLLLAGCGGRGNTAAGSVKMLLSDAPLHLDAGTTVSAVNVTVTRVDLLTADDTAPAVTLFSGSQSVDLLSLANKPLAQLFQLANTTVPNGTYTQVRFILDEANCNVMVDGVAKPLKVASGAQTGLKVVDLNLTVAPGTAQVLLVDFDLSKLHQNGQFLLTPNAVHVAKLAESGTITGKVTLPAALTPTVDIPADITLHLPGSTDVITATEVTLNATTMSGTYVINGVPAGSYVVTITASYGGKDISIDVPATVTAGATTDLDNTELTDFTPAPAPTTGGTTGGTTN